MNTRHSDKPELYTRLRELKVVLDDQVLVLGIALACRASFARIDRLQTSATAKERAFTALFNSRVVLATLRAAAAFAQLRYPNELNLLDFASSPTPDGIGPPKRGDALFKWASEIERSLFRAFDSFDLRECHIPGHEAFNAIPWLQHLDV